jgi:16S rRNA G1207 methylase RsmC
VQSGDRVLDFGCGSGAVGIATAIRLRTLSPEAGHVVCVDCNARAVQCAERGALMNELSNVTAILNHDGVLPNIEPCDLALLNPPYYASFTIAEHFMASAMRALKDGGRAIVVTKQLDEYHIRKFPKLWLEHDMEASGYQLLTYRKRDFV